MMMGHLQSSLQRLVPSPTKSRGQTTEKAAGGGRATTARPASEDIGQAAEARSVGTAGAQKSRTSFRAAALALQLRKKWEPWLATVAAARRSPWAHRKRL